MSAGMIFALVVAGASAIGIWVLSRRLPHVVDDDWTPPPDEEFGPEPSEAEELEQIMAGQPQPAAGLPEPGAAALRDTPEFAENPSEDAPLPQPGPRSEPDLPSPDPEPAPQPALASFPTPPAAPIPAADPDATSDPAVIPAVAPVPVSSPAPTPTSAPVTSPAAAPARANEKPAPAPPRFNGVIRGDSSRHADGRERRYITIRKKEAAGFPWREGGRVPVDLEVNGKVYSAGVRSTRSQPLVYIAADLRGPTGAAVTLAAVVESAGMQKRQQVTIEVERGTHLRVLAGVLPPAQEGRGRRGRSRG